MVSDGAPCTVPSYCYNGKPYITVYFHFRLIADARHAQAGANIARSAAPFSAQLSAQIFLFVGASEENAPAPHGEIAFRGLQIALVSCVTRKSPEREALEGSVWKEI